MIYYLYIYNFYLPQDLKYVDFVQKFIFNFELIYKNQTVLLIIIPNTNTSNKSKYNI